MTREVFEGKYELDSLAAVLKLSNNYYQWTNDTACLRPDWIDAMTLVIDTVTVQQAGTAPTTLLAPCMVHKRKTHAPRMPCDADSRARGTVQAAKSRRPIRRTGSIALLRMPSTP